MGREEDISDEIRNDIEANIRLPDGGYTIWRVGQPRVTEAWITSFNAGRGSGGYGTGVYGYASRAGAEQDISSIAGSGPRRGDPQPVIALKSAIEDPLVLGNALEDEDNRDLKEVSAFHNFGAELSSIAREEWDNPGTVDDLIDQAEDEGYESLPPFRTYGGGGPKDGLSRLAATISLHIGGGMKDRIGVYDYQQTAIEALKACKEAAEQTTRGTSRDGLWLQPINFFLWPSFDGVLPLPGAGGNSNTYGAVILRQRIDECFGEPVPQRENLSADRLNGCFSREID